MAYAIDPFCFEEVPRELPPPPRDGRRDKIGKQPDAF